MYWLLVSFYLEKDFYNKNYKKTEFKLD